MKNDNITLIISAVLLAAALIVLFVGHLRRRNRLKRQLVMDLLKSYFKGDVAANQLGRRAREIVSVQYTYSDEFYALVVSAFQAAVDTTFARQPHTAQADRKLLSAMAALKQEFGLTDRYQVEAWRPGRE
jgi:predicted urease superfamily metal-dependent hydrolase